MEIVLELALLAGEGRSALHLQRLLVLTQNQVEGLAVLFL